MPRCLLIRLVCNNHNPHDKYIAAEVHGLAVNFRLFWGEAGKNYEGFWFYSGRKLTHAGTKARREIW